MTNSAIQSMRTIDRFLQEVAATEKKAAEAHTEPGSVGGPTEHPVKDVDDSTEEAKEGFRSAENAADVKADQGEPSVESTSDNVAAKAAEAEAVTGKSEDGAINPPGTASADQLQIGTKKEPTGQDPSSETSSAKGGKEDPGSSHPARTDNGELDSLKYAEMQIEELSKLAGDLANSLLVSFSKEAELHGDQHKIDVDNDGKIEGSDLAALRSGDKKEAKKEDKEAFDIAEYNKEKAEKKDSDEECDDEEDKEAADLAGQAGWELAGLLSGDFDKKAADKLVQGSLVEIIKTASDDADKVAQFLESYNEELSKKAEGEMPAGIDPAAMMSAGSPEPAAMPAEEAGGEGDVEELAAVLESLGISPEELEAAMAAEAGGEAGMPAEMPAEEATADEAPGMEVEATDKAAAAKKGSAAKATRDYIQEVLERSRR